MSTDRQAQFEKFNPRAYLEEWYALRNGEIFFSVAARNRFLARASKRCIPGGILLDIGCGPTIQSALSFAPIVQEIHLTDLLDSNLAQIDKWLKSDSDAFNWDANVGIALAHEESLGQGSLELCKKPITDQSAIQQRAEVIRRRITRLFPLDVTSPEDLEAVGLHKYDCLVSLLCIDNVSVSIDDFRQLIGRIGALSKPGSLFVLVVGLRLGGYCSGGNRFDALDLTDDVVIEAMRQSGYDMTQAEIEVVPLPHVFGENSALMMVSANKTEARAV